MNAEEFKALAARIDADLTTLIVAGVREYHDMENADRIIKAQRWVEGAVEEILK